jgi:hypothetical protein
MKRALEVPPISQENGCRFTTISASSTKVAVGKVIAMMNLCLKMPVARKIIDGSSQVSLRVTNSDTVQLSIIYPNDFEFVISAAASAENEYDFEIIDLWAQLDDDNYQPIKGTVNVAEHLICWSNYCRKL